MVDRQVIKTLEYWKILAQPRSTAPWLFRGPDHPGKRIFDFRVHRRTLAQCGPHLRACRRASGRSSPRRPSWCPLYYDRESARRQPARRGAPAARHDRGDRSRLSRRRHAVCAPPATGRLVIRAKGQLAVHLDCLALGRQKHWLEKRSGDRTAHPELPQCVSGSAAPRVLSRPPKRIATWCSYQSLSICPRSRSPRSIATAGRPNCFLSGNIQTAIRSRS